MSRRHPISQFIAATAVAATLLAAGCRTPEPKPGTTAAAPSSGPSVSDPRTEAVIQQMEIDYIAAKNSQPTYHHLALAEKKAKEEAQAEAAKKAEAEKQAAAKDSDKKQ